MPNSALKRLELHNKNWQLDRAASDSQRTSRYMRREASESVQEPQDDETAAGYLGDSEREVMALTKNQVEQLLIQHVEDDYVQLEDLIKDYDPGSFSKVELTEFTRRLDEIREKLKVVRLGYRNAKKAMPGPENEENRQYIESAIEVANVMVRNHDANVKQRISELRDDEETAPLSRSDSVNVRTDANFAKSALQCISDQADFLQVKLEECDGLENKPDNVKRDVCAKRLLFLEDMFKIKM